ncbi:hypothetical protein DAI22_06g157600 [Oryza sativa Japonica Group]|nr:hypothetical protein DAI22_06g157600 [Oryza sativa Japonica Group]
MVSIELLSGFQNLSRNYKRRPSMSLLSCIIKYTFFCLDLMFSYKNEGLFTCQW